MSRSKAHSHEGSAASPGDTTCLMPQILHLCATKCKVSSAAGDAPAHSLAGELLEHHSCWG